MYSSRILLFGIKGADGREEAVVPNHGTTPVYNVYGNDLTGKIKRSVRTPTRFYYVKDHLGSVRATVDASGNVASYDDYYPFGMSMNGRSGNNGQSDARYKFTSKERDTETGLDYPPNKMADVGGVPHCLDSFR